MSPEVERAPAFVARFGACALALLGLTVGSGHGCGGTSARNAATPDGGMAGPGRDAEVDAPRPVSTQLTDARAKIKHVIIITQENRSFDHYFGTFPGADGIPMEGGAPAPCLKADDDAGGPGACVAPYHATDDVNVGGPHSLAAFVDDYADGRMDGFLATATLALKSTCTRDPANIDCTHTARDVMGYHTEAEIPNYWAYAKTFTLQDHLFEAVASASLSSHLYMVSGWSATCTPADDPSGCVSDLVGPGRVERAPSGHPASVREYAWTNITHLLHQQNVSWSYFVAGGHEPDCDDGEMTCDAGSQSYEKPSFLNVLPSFDDVKADDQVGNVMDTTRFFENLDSGSLAAVNWLVPSDRLSEHPPNPVTRGQAYVTGIINAVMKSAYWDSSVIFLTWDDWGGFYDHEKPLRVDGNGYGFRVPGLTISPWVKPGRIDKQVLSHDAYLRFIEDVFLGSQRLDPQHDGRPDNRPTVREEAGQLGDLLLEFDFHQKPNPPVILAPCPAGVDTTYSDAGPCSLD